MQSPFLAFTVAVSVRQRRYVDGAAGLTTSPAAVKRHCVSRRRRRGVPAFKRLRPTCSGGLQFCSGLLAHLTQALPLPPPFPLHSNMAYIKPWLSIYLPVLPAQYPATKPASVHAVSRPARRLFWHRNEDEPSLGWILAAVGCQKSPRHEKNALLTTYFCPKTRNSSGLDCCGESCQPRGGRFGRRD